MKYFEAVLIFILGNEFVLGSSNLCKKSDLCTCFNTFEGYEFQCPSSNNHSVVIHTEPDKNLELDCSYMDLEPKELKLDLNILPNYTAGKIEYLKLRFCTLTRDDLFSLVKKFDIEPVESLYLEEIVLRNNSSGGAASITKDFFQGLSSLRTLDISYSRSSIEVDAFENLSNLTALYLDENEIEEIGGMFNDLKYLIVLHLSRNSITNIPNDTFQNLTELQQLHLWKNNLTRIEKNYFTGLKNLKSLELSKNYIQVIDSDAFSELPELINISLRENQLSNVSSDLFRHNQKLYSVRMDFNPNVILGDYLFANFTNLTVVSLEKSGLQIIPEHIFESSENLKIIKMQNNLLQEIPQRVFSGLKKLEELYLGKNKISFISDEIFSSLISLEVLELEDNLISEINRNTFKMTTNLKKLILNNNKIKTISLSAFNNNGNMFFKNLSDNLYDMKREFDGNPFQNCRQLEQLLLSGNLIHEFPSPIMYMLHLKMLDLSYNKIASVMVTDLHSLGNGELIVDLSNNMITELDFVSIDDVKKLDALNNITPSTTVFLYNNTLVCDCRIYGLFQYIRYRSNPAVKTTIDLKLKDSYCTSPSELKRMKIEDLQPLSIRCPYWRKCNFSSECQCFFRPFDETIEVDCSFKNLTECPRIQVDGDRVELNLVGNVIRNGPNSSLGYDNVTNMLLSNNKIEQVKWIPRRTKVLKLDGNHLKHLDPKVLEIMENSSALNLSNNPWTCDCSAIGFQNFIRKHDKILESKDIVCKADNKLLIEKIQLCEPGSTLIMKIAIPILIFIIFTAISTTLYFKYEQEVKWWLFDHKYLLWLITEKELDKDKIYDIFISFSHKDENFVVQNLLPELEQNPDPFKTCIHLRDWKPGLSITENIANSVNDSRRTLVVLSNDFLDSVWGKMEFRAAHIKAIEEGRARVIVVKYGELNEEKLDEELKMYLRSNTYVEWGKPWFWRKLRFALPHSHPQSIRKTQKHANMMLKIDDKFELTSRPLAHSESTPPVVSLDPSLSKYQPVTFQYSPTPPAETPLVVSK